MRFLLILLLAGCGSVSHETRSLMCLGFCTQQSVEHDTKPVAKPTHQGESQ